MTRKASRPYRIGVWTAAFAVCVVVLQAVIGTTAVAAAPGDLDASFGTGGMVTTDLGDSGASDVAIQPDGKLVVVGSTTESCTEGEAEFSCDRDFLVARYNSDGTPDTTFGGGDGIVTTDFGTESQHASAVAVETSGKILVGGTTSESGVEGQSSQDFALARYNSDGTLDTSFGEGGMVTTDFNPEGDEVWSLVLQANGKVVLAGRTRVHEEEEAFSRFALARYNSDGTLDMSFGSGGKAIGPPGHLFGLAEEPGGNLLAAGRAGGSEFAVARFEGDGNLDTTFSDGGIATLNLSSVGSQANDVLVQPDGKIVASGFGSLIGFAVARFNPDGTPDTAFGGGDGVTLTEFSQPCCGHGAAISVALQSDDRIAFAGQWAPDEDTLYNEWAVGRLHPNGAPDKSFGADGLVTTDVGGGYASGIAIQGDGKIVAVGGTGPSTQDLAVARYEGGGSPSPTYHQLLVVKAGPGSGHVSARELNCGVNCGANYIAGETVELRAFAEFGSTFEGWTTLSGAPGTCTGTATPCEVTLNGDVDLVANFGEESQSKNELTVTKSGTGFGTVTSSPVGINCGEACTAEFDEGSEVSLTATAAPDSTFVGWGGGTCSGSGSCDVIMSADTEVTAVFALVEEEEDGGDEGSEAGEDPAPLPPASANGGGGQPAALPASPQSPGKAFFANRGQVKGGMALFRARCSGDTACRGVARLTARVRTKRSVKQRGGQRMARRARNVVIGRGRFNIAPGKAGTVRIRLTGAGKKLLRQGGRRALRARLVGRGVKGRSVMLKPRGGKQQRRRAKRAMAQASSTLKQRCVQAGTGRPKVLKAMMRHPGDRKTQSISIEADYRAMPEECRGVFRRIPEVKFQIQNPKNHRQWFNFSRFRRAVKAFKAAEKELNEVQKKREEQGRECTISNPCSINPRINDKGGLSDMSHSAPLSRFPKGDRRLYRCTPGKRVTQVRALLRNKVKRIGTDRIIEQRTYKAPIRVKRFKYLLPKHRKRGHVRGPC